MVQFELNDDDVVSTNPGLSFLPNATYRCDELKQALKGSFKENLHSWVGQGTPCKVLKTSGGGWKKGKIRLAVVFVPDDEPEQKPFGYEPE